MKKILIVDDNAMNRKVLRKMLLMIDDYQLVEATDGEDAIAVYIHEAPDLILMDVKMPRMDGYQSATVIKASSGEEYVPIIFITALTVEASLSNSLASGGDDFIRKPVDAEVLKSKIHAHFRIRELNQQLNDKNMKLSIHNETLQHQQDLIAHFFESALQKSFLDESFIKYHMTPMSVFNGDLLLVDRKPNGGLYLVMGDFTGHGLTAAMGTLPVAMIFFKMTKKGYDIADIAREINHQLKQLMPPGMFFAATLVELNALSNQLTVWTGGMPECYWLNKSGELKGTIESRHLPLGILNDDSFDNSTEYLNVSVGDKVYFYSDGVIEANNPAGEMFGDERFKNILMTETNERFERVLNELSSFTGVHQQNDDITLVEMTCISIEKESKSNS